MTTLIISKEKSGLFAETTKNKGNKTMKTNQINYSNSLNVIVKTSGYSVEKINHLKNNYQTLIPLKGYEIALIHSDIGGLFTACKEEVGKKDFLKHLKTVFGYSFDKDYRSYAMRWNDIVKNHNDEMIKEMFFVKKCRANSPRGYVKFFEKKSDDKKESEKSAFEKIQIALKTAKSLIDKNGLTKDQYAALRIEISSIQSGIVNK